MNTGLVLDLRTEWWHAPEYVSGSLSLPGQSRLDPAGRKLLEEIGARADKRLLDLPPMPKAAMEAMKTLKSPDCDLPDVSKAIQVDPVLTALVLRQANSALYGARAVIDTVSQAVSYLGIRRMKEIVLGAAMRRVTSDVRTRAYAEQEWQYSITCAAIARRLARRLHLDEEQCYVAGLLHDIGRLPVLQALEAKGALAAPPRPDSTPDIILEALHRGVGLQVAEKWEQPPVVADAVRSHLTGRASGEQDGAQFPSTRVAEAAGDLCVALGIGRHRRPFDVLDAPSLRDLGFSAEDLETWLREELPAALDDVAGLF